MAFYSPDASMDQRLAALVERLAGERGETLPEDLSITWLRYGQSLLEQRRPGQDLADVGSDSAALVRGAAWQGARLRDPGDLVQLVYLIASERWLQRGLLEEEPELRRAQAAMIQQGSHDATSYVVDRLSGTTSGPALAESLSQTWLAQRQLVDAWLTSLAWPELEGCRAAHKTWQDGPYGRERLFLGEAQENGNRFCSDGLARLLEAVLAGSLISPPACQRMRQLLAGAVDLDSPQPPPSLASLLPQGLPASLRVWGKGGRSSRSIHLTLYAELASQEPTLLVLLGDRVDASAVATLLKALLPG